MAVLVSRWAFGTKVLINIQTFGYLDNRCHGYQKTYSDLAKHRKCCGILSGGTLDGYGCIENRYYEPMLPWKPLFIAMVTKKCLLTQRTLLIGSVATPLTRPSERVKVLVINKTERLFYFAIGPKIGTSVAPPTYKPTDHDLN